MMMSAYDYWKTTNPYEEAVVSCGECGEDKYRGEDCEYCDAPAPEPDFDED
jgi:hypothetical protein